MAYYNENRNDVVSRGLHHPKPGLNSVGEYQCAGRPFVKTLVPGSFNVGGNIVDNTDTLLGNAAHEVSVSFPLVTSRVIIQNKGNKPMAVYFCSLTVADANPNHANSAVKANHNYFVLPAPTASEPLPTLDLKVKCRKVYIASYGDTVVGAGYISVAAELTSIEEAYDCDLDNIEGISG